MKVTPKFYPPMWPENYPTLDYTFWEAAEKKWREKQYTSSFKYLLDFINPKVRKQYEIEDNKRYCIPHGSSVIYLTLLDSEVNIMCYLAKLDAANIQVVYNRIQLLNTQHVKRIKLTLENNVLLINHVLALHSHTLTEQYKVLKEICLTADHLDDLIIQQYRASFYSEPQIKKLGASDKILARSIAKAILQETNDYLRFFEWQNNTGNCLAMLKMALKRIDLALQPQGYLKSEITNTQHVLLDNRIPIKERIITGKLLYDLIKNMSVEDFNKNIYLSEMFMPEKKMLPTKKLFEMLKASNNLLVEKIENREYATGATEVICTLYGLLYRNWLTLELRKSILFILQESAEKDWPLACTFLNMQIEKILNENYFNTTYVTVSTS
ncbi:MAG: hypothetical protein ACK48F_05885 [Chryseotalea sp.]